MPPRIDILLIAAPWPERALLRAQLIEEGFEVVAVDSWPIPSEYARGPSKPRLVVVDLHELERPDHVLSGLRVLFDPGAVLVVTGLDTPDREAIARFGFAVLQRPTTIGEIVARAKALLQA